MEANPQFTKELKALEENFPGQVAIHRLFFPADDRWGGGIEIA